MKKLLLTLVGFVLLACLGFQLQAQTAKKNYPESFSLSDQQIKKVLDCPAGKRLPGLNNKYLAKGSVITNVQNGDTRYARVQLPYFGGAFLNIQVNGVYSTQVFILSSDKTLSYRTTRENGSFTFIKCNEDEIVSE